MRRLIKLMLPILVVLIQISCNSTEPKPELGLSVGDVSCTEVWLKVEGASSGEIKLTRDDKEIKNYELLEGNVIYDDSLQPNRTYAYKVSLTGKDITPKKATATTLDTTSSNFTWATFRFGGQGGSSYLNDIAIIDENNIWAVGQIYQNEEKYNAIHWNGTEWELKKILFYTFCNQNDMGAYSAKAIFYFDDGMLAIGGHSQIAWIQNGYYQMTECIASPVNVIWGSSSKDFYVGGNNGNLAHYNGSTWRKIESGTELNIYDIWGDYNESSNEWEVLAVAAKLLKSTERDIIRINGQTASIINDNGITQPLRSIWFKSSRLYITLGSGVYKKKSLSDTMWSHRWEYISQYFTNSVRGQNVTDIFVVGSYNEVLHYNGENWYSFKGKINNSQTSRLLKVSVKNNLCCVVGRNENKAIVYLGSR